MDIQHAAIRVSDLEATREFYEEGLGLEYSQDFHTDEGVHNYYVTGDELDTELQFVHDPDSDAGAPEPTGIVHLALRVDDVDAAVERVVDRTDCPVVQEPTTIEPADARAAFVADPDGYEIELFRPLE
ncbi:VOC family protein [Haloterrigena alkaliphila]|uniref:VOC family protein n=1 Tax=Haloterrigena alkaliphila TaxID=2816475 RepID=A0A8A2VBW6_9EURY|nr:VOC family protein [Haloterrigena alkaliphila]QSW98656.1 VOC family protein [Haloterrigena alkaliphila]